VTTVRARFERQTEPAYDADTASGRLLVERRLSKHWTARAGYDVEWTDVTDTRSVSEREFTDPTGRFFLSYFELGARWSDTDDELDPTRGTWLDVSAIPSGGAIGSDFDYVRGTIEGRAYVPLGKAVLASRVLLGTIAPFASTEETDLPITKLFYGGGTNSVRGYGYQRLGNTNAEGDPVGGASLLEGTLELRFPIWSALRGVAFVDAGTISPDAWKWSTSRLLWAAGGGFRYSTPLGPVRLDAGFPLNAPPGVQGYRIWLSIGQAF
jgi:outer membrane translocation and assembly module TamA